MQTTKVNAASVAEIPTQAAIAAKQLEVNYLQHQLAENFSTPMREHHRSIWAKARAELSRMQAHYHFSGKEVCHV